MVQENCYLRSVFRSAGECEHGNSDYSHATAHHALCHIRKRLCVPGKRDKCLHHIIFQCHFIYMERHRFGKHHQRNDLGCNGDLGRKLHGNCNGFRSFQQQLRGFLTGNTECNRQSIARNTFCTVRDNRAMQGSGHIGLHHLGNRCHIVQLEHQHGRKHQRHRQQRDSYVEQRLQRHFHHLCFFFQCLRHLIIGLNQRYCLCFRTHDTNNSLRHNHALPGKRHGCLYYFCHGCIELYMECDRFR